MPGGPLALRSTDRKTVGDAQVEAMMQAHRIHRVPVIDADGHPIGIVSLNDLARRAHTGHRNGNLGADAVVKTLAVICSSDGHAAAAE